MSDTSQHLSDEVILQFVDNELQASAAGEVQEHLSACHACRERQSIIESTSNAVLGLYCSELPKVNVNALESRVRLEKRLRRFRQTQFWPRSLVNALSFRLVLTSALTVLLIVLFFRGAQDRKFSHLLLGAQAGVLVPDRSLTPGAVRPVTLTDVCPANDSALDPEVSPSTEKAVLNEYGIHPEKHSRNYQIDYLVNPQLGGTNDIRNLWPEPYSSRWNANAKDELERRLQQMVCNRTIDLAVAQKEIETNWIAAYKRYIRNERS